MDPHDLEYKVVLGQNFTVPCTGFFGDFSKECPEYNPCIIRWTQIPVTEGREDRAIVIGDNSTHRVYATQEDYEDA